MLGSKVIAVQNFETDTIRDVEGDEIPREKMLIFRLADKTRVAVRGSGTEPKIKYYLFAQRCPDGSEFTRAGARGHQTPGRRQVGRALGVVAGRCCESNRLRLAEACASQISQPLLDIRPSTVTIPA